MRIMIEEKNGNKKVVCDVPLDVSKLDLETLYKEDMKFYEIGIKEYILIPYNDNVLCEDSGLQLLAALVAEETDWVYPDYNKIETFIIVNIKEDLSLESSIYISVQPPQYTDKEKENILSHEKDDENYQLWESIFCFTDDFYKGEGNYSNNNDEFNIELTEDEEYKLRELLNI